MRARWLEGVAAGALLATTLGVASLGVATLGLLTAAPALAQQADPYAASIPVPDAATLPPPTIADVQKPVGPAAAAKPADEPATTAAISAPESTAEPGKTRAGDAPSGELRSVDPDPAAAPAQAGNPADTALPAAGQGVSPALASADAAVAEKLKDLISGKLDRLVPAKRDRTAIEDFYKAREYAPLWVENGSFGARAEALVKRLKAADADGLDAADYATPDITTLAGDPDALAQNELKLDAAALAFARNAQSGRVTPSRISTNIDVHPPVPDSNEVLKTLASATDIAASLDRFNPPHKGFRLLKAKLAELRGSGEAEVAQIPPGRTLHPGKQDKRVPLLRERLGLTGDADDTTYDPELVAAVKQFQKDKHQKPNGVVSASTIDALNGRSHGREIAAAISNMERWRWLPRDLGESYVMVNIPDFSLKTVRDGATVFQTRIVVGKPNTPSPTFSAQIENVLVNPTWNVPESIIYGEYLPKLNEDPGLLDRLGLVMERKRDGTITIKQPPSERNALGRIKFNFPNKFQVYLHDTPDKRLFANDRRAFSHGCMRVQNPTQFGEALLAISMPEQHYTAARLQSMFGKGERWLNFKRKIPVHITYMNAFVDDAGKLVVRDDVYGYDGRVQSALHGEYLTVNERSQRVVPGQRPAVTASSGSQRRKPSTRHEATRREAMQRRPVMQAPMPQREWSLFPFFQ